MKEAETKMAHKPSLEGSAKRRALLEALLQDEGIASSSTPKIPRRDVGSPTPLSFAQESLWVFEQMMPATPLYNIATSIQLSGPLQVKALEQGINEIVRRHEILRTTFKIVDEEPLLSVAPSLALPLPLVDLQQLPDAERDAKLLLRITEEAHRPFDLSQGPLLRTTMWRLGPQEHVFLVVMHHIISEASSVAIFFQELSAVYAAFIADKTSPLPPLALQYGDYAAYQRQRVRERGWLEPQLAYWTEQLRGRLPVLELPTDRPRPSMRTCSGHWQSTEISAPLLAGLKNVSRQEGTTLFMTLLAAFSALLYRYTGQEDIVIGSPATNRNAAELNNLIGYFINPQPLRTDLSGNPTFRELLRRVREVCLSALSHQDVPLERLIEELKIERHPTSNPLFQTAFVLHNTAAHPSWRTTFTLAGVRQQAAIVRTRTAKLDLTLEVEETGGGLTAVLEYNTDLFEENTITRMLQQFETLLQGIVSNPDEAVGRLPLLSDSERRWLLSEWNDTTTDYPRQSSIQELFEEQVKKSPDAIAAIFAAPGQPTDGAPCLTYAELNRRANRAAHHFIKLGVGQDSLVGLCMERSLEMLVSLIGILKAGGGYVPLDPGYPAERLAHMIADTRIEVLLVQKRFAPAVPPFKGTLIHIDADHSCFEGEPETDPAVRSGAENLAYVMFTSGSTGVPKGVAVVHRAVVRLVKNTNYAKFGPDEVFLHFAPISFDASTLELWGPLLNGGRVVMFPPSMPALEELGQVIREYGVTTLWLTSALFRLMVEQRLDDLRGVRQLLSGGDVLPAPQVDRVAQELDCQLINGYGPTENTTFTCCYRIPRKRLQQGTVPIGRPISNTRVYILDKWMEPVPVGVQGELYIAGDGLARGYINRPELTAERFVPNPLSEEPGAVLYKTGDVVRYRANGDIEFFGRRDHQVKLRGYRIETGEIESVLGRHPSLKEVVVIVREQIPGDKRLVGYVVPQPGESADAGELRSFLRRFLPDYMVPSVLIAMEALPLSPNGKVDRNALPSIGEGLSGARPGFAAPRNDTERAVREIWREILKVDQIGVHDNFFELGGDSLMTTRIMSRLKKKFQNDLPLRALFEQPTIAGLASLLSPRAGTDRYRSRWENRSWSSLIPIQPRGTRHPLFLVAGAHAHEDDLLRYLSNLIPHLGLDQPVFGFMARGLDGIQTPHQSVEEMAADYVKELLEFQPEGPYFIAGECIGGIVAYEMAQQLHARGKPVRFLALLDTIRPDEKFKQFVDSIYTRWKYQKFFCHFRRLSALSLREGARYLLEKTGRKVRLALPTSKDARKTNHIRLVEDNYPRVLSRYIPSPYAGRLTLILNEEISREYSHGRWDGMALGGLDVQLVPGNHVTRLTQYADCVAERLTRSLNESLSAEPTPFDGQLTQARTA